MARTSLDCSVNALLDNSKCFRDPCVGPMQRQAIQIVLLNIIIAGLKDTNLESLAELLEDGKCFQPQCVSPMELDAIRTYILFELAMFFAEGLTPPTPGDLIKEVACLSCSGINREGLLTQKLCDAAAALISEQSE